MSRLYRFTAASTITLALTLVGCASPQTDLAAAPTVTVTAPAPVEAVPTPTPTPEGSVEAPVSDIEAAVDLFISALDELGIEHSEPVRAEVGASGAKARFDLTVNTYSAGINVFPAVQRLAAWQELSDAYGGIHVAAGNAVITLNSSEGIANSAEIAPLIAATVGGEARGV